MANGNFFEGSQLVKIEGFIYEKEILYMYFMYLCF